MTDAAIRVSREFATEGEISPFQCGQFIEYVYDLVPGMWAEKLHDAGFEGPDPYRRAFRKETDFRERPWYPVGAVHRGEYVLDEQDAFNGKVSQRIAVRGEPCTLGVAQDGISLGAGTACRLSLHLRQEGLREPVRAHLRGVGGVLAEAQFRPERGWRRFTARLVPAETTVDATFAVEFRGPGTLWIDQVSLMPEDAPGGWRADVIEALRELRPGIIRFGGNTTETFDWRNLIGDPDRRVP
jgi:alpha-N-arabinofuranosidase